MLSKTILKIIKRYIIDALIIIGLVVGGGFYLKTKLGLIGELNREIELAQDQVKVWVKHVEELEVMLDELEKKQKAIDKKKLVIDRRLNTIRRSTNWQNAIIKYQRKP